MKADCESLTKRLKNRLIEEGFDAANVVSPAAIPELAPRLQEFIRQGYHGTMGWLEANVDRRIDPNVLWPDVKSIVMVTMNYGPASNPLDDLAQKDRAAISAYAKGADYHDIMKKALKRAGRWFVGETGHDIKVFVDTAPVMEKPLAQAAGLGWQGKHTNLVSRAHGSWLFLGAFFTTAELEPDLPERDHCGSCRACLDVCPTDAFPAPYQLDARRCISYLTIEHKGPIPMAFREAMGNRIYGCDDCLAVCPWNKFASRASELRFHAREETDLPALGDLLTLDDTAFRARYAGSPIKRIGRNRFVRNVLIAAGNSGEKALVPKVQALLSDDCDVVRDAAAWAAARLSN